MTYSSEGSMARILRYLHSPQYSLSTLFIIVTSVACFFGVRASRNREVAKLLRGQEAFTASTECTYRVAVILREVEGGLYEVSAGSEDGVKLNSRGTVSRGDTFLGLANFERMSGERSVVRLDRRFGAKVQRGDHVEFSY
jgi:hypothetical protein